MAPVDHYRDIIRQVIGEYATSVPSVGDVQIETIFDPSNDHFELIYSGWNGSTRIHGSVLHVDVRGEKVWIQHDGTEEGIAEELVRRGIPRDRIVLAFRPPEVRRFTDYAAS